MHLFEISLRPHEVKEETPEKTAEKRRRIALYESFCYMAVVNNSLIEANKKSK